MSQFPFNYFTHIFTAKKMFQARYQLKWWQMIFITLFLIAVLMLPVTINTATYQSYPMTHFVNGAYDSLTEANIQQAKQYLTINNNHLSGKNMSYKTQQHHLIYFDKQQLTTIKQQSNVLFFDTDHFNIYQQGKMVANIHYQNLTPTVFNNKANLIQFLNQTWFNQNKLIIIATLLLIASGLLTFNFIFISIGSSLFLLLTRRAKLFNFETFKSCYNFILNCLALPTFISSFIGFIHYDIITIITIQNILFVLILITVFYKTHFKN